MFALGDEKYGYYLITHNDGTKTVEFEQSRNVHMWVFHNKIRNAEPMTYREAKEYKEAMTVNVR